jgi:hypothetical protein
MSIKLRRWDSDPRLLEEVGDLVLARKGFGVV